MIFEEQISRKPNHYPWTKDFIDSMHNGHWTSNEFSFQADIQEFKTKLTDLEKEIIVKTLSSIGQIEVAVKKFWAKLGDNLPHPALTDLGYVMANVEVVHNDAYERLLLVLGLEDIFEENLKLEVIQNRVNYLRKYLHKYYKDSKKQYVYSLILFTIFIENVSLFSQFYIILWFNRYKNVLKDTGQQVDYTKVEECFIEGTEVLTPSGWKDFREINIGDPVFQYTEQGTIEHTNVLHKVENAFSGELVHIFKQGHACKVTPKHEILFIDQHNNYRKKTAEDIKFHSIYKIPVAGKLNNQSKTTLSFEDRLKIAIQADGSNCYWKNIKGDKLLRGKNNGYTHCFKFTKERKKERLEWILNNLKLEFYKSPINKNLENTYYIKFKHDFNYKEFDWIKLCSNTSYKWCEEFIKELVLWDGFNNNVVTDGYCSTNKKCIDIAQVIGILAGYKTTIGKGNESARKEGYNDCYKLNFSKENSTPAAHAIKKIRESYQGKVYCISVPSGNIITRLNDKTFITGNCLHAQAGIKIIETIQKEHPELFDEELKALVAKETGEAFKAESKLIDWILGDFNEGNLNKESLKEFVKDRLNNSLVQINFDPVFEINKELIKDTLWFEEDTLGNNKKDFFYKRPTEYTKNNRAYNSEDLF